MKKRLDREYIKYLIRGLMNFSTMNHPPGDYLNFLKVSKKIFSDKKLKTFRNFYDSENKDHIDIFETTVKYILENQSILLFMSFQQLTKMRRTQFF